TLTPHLDAPALAISLSIRTGSVPVVLDVTSVIGELSALAERLRLRGVAVLFLERSGVSL
ncbi:MAG: hypothetical protein NTY46_15435, partial [Candidatus Sumerlaeota bacterium]|nr:hypothetical protein [Candidatus Sumerlaeota bacterium]